MVIYKVYEGLGGESEAKKRLLRRAGGKKFGRGGSI